jgi:deoxyribodipyrimidine photo-lyase
MWLASYVVHLRKVHWRAGADWLYGHLLDGDLASNHLSWQWVAGTGSHKPYLFNAENVERYAPPPWHCRGSIVDTDYDSLDRMARSPRAVPGGRGVPVAEPPLCATPPPALRAWFGAASPAAVQGQAVCVVHAWDLADPSPAQAGQPSVAVLDAAFHRRWPWSARRWQFVGARLQALAPAQRWWGEAAELVPALQAAATCSGTHSAHLGSAWAGLPWQAVPRLFQAPASRAGSFSKFFAAATRGLRQAAELAVD